MTLKCENLKKLVETLREIPEEHFSMHDWVVAHQCGTVACIAGWCAVIDSHLESEIRNTGVAYQVNNAYDKGKEFLGLTSDQAERLFVPGKHIYATKEQAIATLEYLGRTGRVNWNAAQRAKKPTRSRSAASA